MELWCPFAVRQPVPGHGGAGGFTGGEPKICHHSTEGSSYVGAFGAYRATGSLPHFTDSFEGGIYNAWQHLPLDVAATALKHPKFSGETNKDNVVQIEHVGQAATSSHWATGYLDGQGRLCRWIEEQTGCAPRATVRFVPGAPRLTWEAFHLYNGHLGHMHVPFNDHTDPGALDIDRILSGGVPQGVKPMFDPPLSIVAWTLIPGGCVAVGPDGGVFCEPGTLYAGGPNGKPYFAGRHPARIEAPNVQEAAAGKRYAVVATSGERYAYPE